MSFMSQPDATGPARHHWTCSSVAVELSQRCTSRINFRASAINVPTRVWDRVGPQQAERTESACFRPRRPHVVDAGVAHGALGDAGGDRPSARWARRAHKRVAAVTLWDESHVAPGGRLRVELPNTCRRLATCDHLGGQRAHQRAALDVSIVGSGKSDDAGEDTRRDLMVHQDGTAGGLGDDVCRTDIGQQQWARCQRM